MPHIFGRLVPHEQDGTDLRVVDPVDVPQPLDAAYDNENEWLGQMFRPRKAEWKEAGQWFVKVPDDAFAGLSYKGTGDTSDPTNYNYPAPPEAPEAPAPEDPPV